MKNLTIILIISISFGFLISCEKGIGEFLDKAPGVDVTEDTIFSSIPQMETFLATCYENGLPVTFPNNAQRYGTAVISSWQENALSWGAVSDEANFFSNNFEANSWNVGSISWSNISGIDCKFYARWSSLRMIHTMMERVETVPDIDPIYAGQIKAEMKFLRALNYLDMLRRYGGSPIVTKRFTLIDDFRIKRSSLDSTVQFIVKDCDEAAAILPDVWPANWKGRVTKGAALACKAKTLLLAASPLFNTATPYMEMPNSANNRLICYTNYNQNRWKLAADAAKAVLDWAPAGGIQLITDQGVDKNYRYAWEVTDNAEIIFADKSTNGTTKQDYPTSHYMFLLPNAFGGNTSVDITQTFIEKFYDKRDGTPQTWGATGTDLNQKYEELDYRFAQSIGYNGAFFNTQRGTLQLYEGGMHATGISTGAFMRKWIPITVNAGGDKIPANFPIYRLAEFYLSYAEALNELNGTPPEDAYIAVNMIRSRSGMPDLPTGLTKDQFREYIQKEWAVEYFGEDHRYWDIKRWMIAENPGVMSGPISALKIKKFGTATPVQQFSYERFNFENRVWKRNFYLLPYQQTEVNKGYLVQNPGW